MSETQSSVVIVGAGVFGTSAALELVQRGHPVTLLDPGPIPHILAASTDISKVLRMDYGADEFYMELMEAAFDGWDRWNKQWGAELYHQTGMLFLVVKPMASGGFEHESYQLLQARGHPAERLTMEQVSERFPAWNVERYAEAYLNPRAGWAESGEVVARLLAESKRLGVSVRGGMAMEQLLLEGSRVVGVATTTGEQYRADTVVVAAGAWTPTLLPELGEVMWAVGQPVYHFQVAELAAFQPPAFITWSADISNTGWYGFPAMDDGTLKVANHGPGQRQPAGAPRVVDPEHEPRFREFLRGSLPALADAPAVFNRLCMYCDTWDGDLWIDRDPQREGLVVAAGGSGHGFKFAPMLGPIIADVVEGRGNRFAARFAWRERGTTKTEEARYAEN